MATDLTAAFPRTAGVTDAMFGALAHMRRTDGGTTLVVAGETVFVPHRVYLSTPDLRDVIASRSGSARTAALCLGARHHDGFLRQDCVRELMVAGLDWVVPFVVMPVGEYVIEIIKLLFAAVDRLDARAIGSFFGANPAFMATMRRRVVSYWDCYYRTRHPELAAYPGMQLFDRFARWASP